MITKAVVNILLNNATVASLVGTRVYANVIPQNSTYPCIYVAANNLSKFTCYGPTSSYEGNIEIGVYAKNYGQPASILNAIRNVLDDFDGVNSGVSIAIEKGMEQPDAYDQDAETHVKMIEYQAFAEAQS